MKIVLISALGLAMAAATVPANASGTQGGAGGTGNGWGSLSGKTGIDQAERLQRRGRSQVRKHITCKKCDYHDRLDRNTAREVARGVLNGQFDIKEKDRTAVLLYLRDRYGL